MAGPHPRTMRELLEVSRRDEGLFTELADGTLLVYDRARLAAALGIAESTLSQRLGVLISSGLATIQDRRAPVRIDIDAIRRHLNERRPGHRDFRVIPGGRR